MIKNYFKTAWRNLIGTKFYSAVNIAGLAIGLATAILLLLWVNHERSYDRFHNDYKRTYKILAHFDANGEERVWDNVPGPLYGYSQSMPGVESVVRINYLGKQVIADEDRSKVLDDFSVAFVDSTFLEVFDFAMLDGQPDRLFPNNNSVVVTQSTATKFFGEEDPIGQVLQCGGDNFVISGVLDDFPDNSSLTFDALFPMGYYAAQFTSGGGNGEWRTIDSDLGNYYYETYVKLQDGVAPNVVANTFTEAYNEALNRDLDVRYTLQPLASIHLVSADGNDAPARMVNIFLIIAILTLAIAAINYINLSTARSFARSHEVGMRKIVGASRGQLFFQFILETTLLFGFAVVLALGLVYLLLPVYHLITGVALSFSFTDAAIWNVIGKTAIGMLLASAVYPALLLSDFQPLQALRGRINPRLGAGRFRQVLVVFQFTTSIVLMVATMVIGRQLHHIRHVDLGYDKEYVFTVPLPAGTHRHADAIKSELENHVAIAGVSRTDIGDLSHYDSATGDLDWAGKPADKLLLAHQAVVDKDFIEVMDMELLEGRNFAGTPADSNHYILNEAAIREMGLDPPFIGQRITFHSREGTIIGIVKDFNFQPLKKAVEPMLFFRWWDGNVLYVRTSAQHAKQAVEAAEAVIAPYAGDQPFHYHFLDEQFEAKYIADQRAGLLFNVFAGIAIFISCLGLLGLSTHTVRQRVKEIGIRKVLGASANDVVMLLSKGSLLLVLLSIVVGTPIAWWLMNIWLADFAYRIELEWWMFAGAGSVAVVIALLTVSWQAIRVAVANPVDSLRDE